MAKRYVVREESGCGSLLVWLFVIGLVITIAPYLIAGVVVILAIWAFFYLPKRKEAKRRQQEEAEIVERERQIDLEVKRLELEKREQELNAQKNKLKKTSTEDEWGDF